MCSVHAFVITHNGVVSYGWVCSNFVGACQDLRTAIKKLDKLLRRVKVGCAHIPCIAMHAAGLHKHSLTSGSIQSGTAA